MTTLTRRELLGTAAVAAFGLTRPARAASRRRVVVVGAGLAGLTCARELARAGFDVTVLEARDRVGGRVLTLRDTFTGSAHAEAGAELIGARHRSVQALARQLGIRLVDVPVSEGVVYRRERRILYDDFATPRVRADIARFHTRAASLRGEALDGRSAAWLMRDLELSDRARFLVRHGLRDTYGVEPESLSLLFLAQQEQLGRGRGKQFRVRGGTDLLPLALALRLDVRLETSVSHIERRTSGITVNGIEADASVVTVPVPLLASIEFEPGLPPTLAAAVEHLQYGHGVTSLLQYETPRRLDAQADLTFQTASARGRIVRAYTAGRNGLLLGSVSRRARPLLVADELDEVYPGSRAAFELGDSVSWHSDGWSRGTAVAYAPAQVGRFQAALRQPIGRLVFAGEHTDDYAGTMEGAVRSGFRAAQSIAER